MWIVILVGNVIPEMAKFNLPKATVSSDVQCAFQRDKDVQQCGKRRHRGSGEAVREGRERGWRARLTHGGPNLEYPLLTQSINKLGRLITGRCGGGDKETPRAHCTGTVLAPA